jgi:AcrR family transcriptional regulator
VVRLHWGAYGLDKLKFRDSTLLKAKTRIERRRRRNREALLNAAAEVIGEKGIDAATMSEITNRADVGVGTVYYYFKSKEELSVAVMEWVMDRLGSRIRKVTDTLEDPGQGYAFGCRTVMEVASRDPQWRWLLKRTDVVADTMIRAFGRYGRDDMRQAIKAGRYKVKDIELAWRMTIWCLVGVSVNLCEEHRGIAKADAVIEAAVVHIQCLLGMDYAEAKILASRLRALLPPEEYASRPLRQNSQITKPPLPSRLKEPSGG